MANKRALIDPPPFTPLRFGLLSAAIDRTSEAPSHWQAGVTWQSHCPDGNGTYDPCLVKTRAESPEEIIAGEVPNPPSKEPTSFSEDDEGVFYLRGATPFTVYTRFDCAPVGFWDRAQELSIQALTRVETHQVERIFDTGVAPTQVGGIETAYPHLRADSSLTDDTGAVLQTIADEVTSSTVDIVEAFGRLESALADCYHGRGVIHVPAVLSAALSEADLVMRSGGVLETQLGNRVVLGTGYSGQSPSGASSDSVAWIYATGAVFYIRGDVRINQLVDSFNRSQNTVEMIAERSYVLGWDCCHFAIPVHIGGVSAGVFDDFNGGS